MKMITIFILFLTVILLFTINLSAQEIFDAVRNGDLSKVKELIENNPELVKAKNQRGAEPLHASVSLDHIDITKYLIEKGGISLPSIMLILLP